MALISRSIRTYPYPEKLYNKSRSNIYPTFSEIHQMILHSTGGNSQKVSLPQGIAHGIAPDGGLYMPDSFPKLPNAFFNNLPDMQLQEIAFVIANTLFGEMVPAPELKQIVFDALNFQIPVRRVKDRIYSCELFYGPTLTFKDVGARFMARLLPKLDPAYGSPRDIIVATSGDSGAAVADGFSRTANTRVFVLYPKGELTRLQIAGFASVRNVVAIEVDGSFDQCQAMAKEVVRANAASHHASRRLTSANSINLLRQLPGIIYYFHAYARVAETHPGKEIVFSVPCGNLGNLSAGLMAKAMGLPAKRFIAANNANDVFVEYLRSGDFAPREALLTVARAMDVGNPSNLARIIDLYGGDLERLRSEVEGVSLSDDAITGAMRRLWLENQILAEPQTAAAIAALEHKLQGDECGIAIASAHPAIFTTTVKAVTGATPRFPTGHSIPATSASRVIKIPPTLSALNRILNTHC